MLARIFSLSSPTFFAAIAAIVLAAPAANAIPIVILETATIGGGVAGGGGVGRPTYVATRFQAAFTGDTVAATVRLSRPFNFGAVEMFAAVIALSGPTDFPDSSNLTASDVLGSAVFSYSGTSNSDWSVALGVPIVGGQWYALAFGSGLLGATGGSISGLGYSLANSGPPTTFFNQTNTEFVWDSTRFVLTAEPVPEPSTALLVGLGLVGLAAGRRASEGG